MATLCSSSKSNSFLSVTNLERAIEAIENADEFVSVPSSMTSPNAKYFGLKVKGLSMIDKGIFDGDIAVLFHLLFF